MTAEAILALVKKFWLPAIIAVLIGALAISASHYKGKAEQEKQRADGAEHSLKLANATIIDMQTRQRDVAELDAKYTKELADAKAENDALQHKLDNGGRVLVKGKCPVSAATQTAGSAGVGDDATVELSSLAGRNVLGIRSGIKQDQAALKALQEYIINQCLK
ncbi:MULTISPECIES: lysis protein [Bacteria]|uniref:lysis protein n=1 Tax=Bacteria TaxID=2 RepID=UPI00115AC6F4|nr:MULTISPECIES: lysis protein [Bacteria]HCQ7871331.1 lysis protein [Klebsiella pneumoniae]